MTLKDISSRKGEICFTHDKHMETVKTPTNESVACLRVTAFATARHALHHLPPVCVRLSACLSACLSLTHKHTTSAYRNDMFHMLKPPSAHALRPEPSKYQNAAAPASAIGVTRIAATAERRTRALRRRSAVGARMVMTDNPAAVAEAAEAAKVGPRVAVIGAGGAGLCAGRLLREEGCRVTIFEKCDHVGGVWRYRPDPEEAAPMYRSLVTNLPKEIMSFFGLPFPEELKSFTTHQQVLDYLKAYADEYGVGPLVKPGCEIESVRPIPLTSDSQQAATAEGGSAIGDGKKSWQTPSTSSSPPSPLQELNNAGTGEGMPGNGVPIAGWDREGRAVGKWEVIYTENGTADSCGEGTRSSNRGGSSNGSVRDGDNGGGKSKYTNGVHHNHHRSQHCHDHAHDQGEEVAEPKQEINGQGEKGANGVGTAGDDGDHDGNTDHGDRRLSRPAVRKTEVFDAICVCTGHYEKPFIPKTEGWEHFTGKSMHARAYDHPGVEEFVGKRVLCVGSRSSGTDVAREVSSVASVVHVCDRAAAVTRTGGGERGNVVWRPALVRFEGSNGIRFKDGSLTEVDTVVWCTGYDYSFPFLEGSGLLTPPVSERVHPLYEQLFHVQHPSLSFIGLPQSIVPFPLFDLQANAVAAAISGRTQLPTRAEREQWLLAEERKMLEERGVNSASRGVHVMKSRQWAYFRRLLQLAGGPGAILRGRSGTGAKGSLAADVAQHGNGSIDGSGGGGSNNDDGAVLSVSSPFSEAVDGTAAGGATPSNGHPAGVDGGGGAGKEIGNLSGAEAEGEDEEETHIKKLLAALKIREAVYNDTGGCRPPHPGGPDDYRRRQYHIDYEAGTFSVTMAEVKANGEGPSTWPSANTPCASPADSGVASPAPAPAAAAVAATSTVPAAGVTAAARVEGDSIGSSS